MITEIMRNTANEYLKLIQEYTQAYNRVGAGVSVGVKGQLQYAQAALLKWIQQDRAGEATRENWTVACDAASQVVTDAYDNLPKRKAQVEYENGIEALRADLATALYERLREQQPGASVGNALLQAETRVMMMSDEQVVMFYQYVLDLQAFNQSAA